MNTGVGKNAAGIPEDAPRAWRRWSRRAQDLAAVGWASFLSACFATGVTYGLIDPRDLNSLHPATSDLPIQAGYAIGFFFFWLVGAIACAIAVFLIRTSRRRDGSPRRESHH